MFKFLLFLIVSFSSVFGGTRDTPKEVATLYGQYEELQNPPITQQWKAKNVSPIDCIKTLDDDVKPRLPQGFMWSVSDAGDLHILKHQCVEVVDFHIYVFGPDKNDRVQFIVTQNNVPIHGFAMTRIKEEFPGTHRSTFPMTSDDYKRGIHTMCRGHVLDYKDTFGKVTDPSISTFCTFNYKPEPWGYWARTLRTWLVGDLRVRQGSYSEHIFHPFNPKKTNNKTLIPAGVIFEGFPSTVNASENYLVDWKHECHDWLADDVSISTAKKRLLSNKRIRPLVWNRQNAINKQKAYLNGFFRNGNEKINDFVDAHYLMMAAETEYSESTLKLSYVEFSVKESAPLSTIKFWLNRSVLTAQYIDDTYCSVIPAFPATVLDSVKKILSASNAWLDIRIQETFSVLEQIHDNVLYGRIRLDSLFIKDDSLELKYPELPPAQSFEIDCSNKSPTTIKALTPEIEAAVFAGKTLKITGIKGWQMARKLEDLFKDVQTKYPANPINVSSYEGNVTKAVNDALSKYRH